MGYRSSSFITAVLLVSSFTGCFSSTDKGPEAKEISPDSYVTSNDPEDSLFDRARGLYSRRLYSVSTASFESLKNAYPLGAYAEYAEIKVADSHFELAEYEDAAIRYEAFLKEHPASPSQEYVMMQTARSFHLSQKGIGRDSSQLERALEYYNQFIEEYPNSIYLAGVKRYRKELITLISDIENSIIDFYRKRNMTAAVESRESSLKEKLALIEPEPETKNESEISKPPMLIRASLSDKEMESTKIKRRSISKERNLDSVFKSIQCSTKKGHQIVTVRLSSTPKGETLTRFEEIDSAIQSQNGTTSVKLPFKISKETKQDCFGNEDLAISTEGVLKIKTARNGTVVSLQDPPRLLIVLG